MKQGKHIARAGLLAAILLLITLVTTFAADSGEIEATAGVDGHPYRALNTAVAANGQGIAVVAWAQDDGTYPNPQKVYVRRYDSSDTPITDYGVTQIVALPSSRIAGFVDVAMNDSGAFVVVWTQNFTDADGYSVHAALYNANGNEVRAPFQVNTSETGDQWQPSVAMADGGNFFVAWDQKDSVWTAVDEEIYAQRYDNEGQPVGSEFLVNTNTSNYQHQVDVSMASDGKAIAVWHSEPSYYGTQQDEAIYGQLFNSDSTRYGGEIQISPSSIALDAPVVAIDDDGAFVAAWVGDTSSGANVYARQFDAKGTASNDEFMVNTEAAYGQRWPDIAADGAGNFAIVWQSDYQDGAGSGIYAKLYDSNGVTASDEFRVNVRTDETEEFPAVAMSDVNHYMFAWDRYLLPNDGVDGIYTRFLDGPPANTAPAVSAGIYYGSVLSGAKEAEPYTLSAASASDPDGDALTYAWTVDNDSLCSFLDPTVLNPTITCSDNGDFVVTLTVNDGATTNTSNGPLRVHNVAPDITISGADTVAVGEAYTLTLGEIVDPGDDTVSGIRVYWGDGTSDLYSESGNATHIYDAPGNLTVFVSLTDEDGSYHNRDSLSLSVTTSNSAPAAGDDSYAVDEDTFLDVTAPGVLSNDSDDHDALNPVLVDGGNVSNGSLALNADGSFTYAPAVNYYGSDSFTYKICDSEGLCDTATVVLTINPVNDPPASDARGPYSGDEGSTIVLDGGGSDVDGDPLSYTWSSDGPCTFSDPSVLNPILNCTNDGEFTLTLTVYDGTAMTDSDTTVTVANVAPTADLAISSSTIDEGSSVTLTFSNQSDPSADDTDAGFTYSYDCDGDGAFEASDVSSDSYGCLYDDDGAYTAVARIADKDGGYSEYMAEVTVANVAPTIDAIAAPAEPVAIDTQPFGVTVTFSDPGADTHTTTVDWGDGTSDAYGGPSPVSASHTYIEPGVYALDIEVADDDGGSDSAVYEYVVIYDPDGGFVAGHGRIDSAAASCYPDLADPDKPAVCNGADGDARFGFVSRYKKGATAPTGRTDFDFVTGDLHFDSESYDWLLVNQNGANAQFKGTGTINGALAPNGELYKFQIWAGEGTSSSGEDTFRIKIWFEDGGTEYVVYDNGFDQPIANGKIKVQTN